jgi:hypothetical protein
MHVPLSYPVLVPGIHAFPGVVGKAGRGWPDIRRKDALLSGHDGN